MKKPTIRIINPLSGEKNISKFIEEMFEYKIWERFDKNKEEQKKINTKHKVLIMHYSGMLVAFTKGTDRNNIVSLVCGCNLQTAKEYSTNINDYQEMKNLENLTIVLEYFKSIKFKPAIDLVNKDLERLSKRLKNKLK
jgi:hypothetical protein